MGLLDSLTGGDPASLYGVDLSDQQRSALAMRGLLGAAGAFGQAAMPSRMPIPIGAALGSAAAAMGGAQDSALANMLKARLTGAQTSNLTASTAKTGVETQQLQQMMKMRPELAGQIQQWLSGGGQGAAAPGGSPAAPTAGAGNNETSGAGLTASAGGVDPGNFYSYLTNDLKATPNEAALLTSAAGSESSFRPDITHDGGIGYGLFGHNGARLTAMQQQAGSDTPGWQDQAKFALNELRSRPEGALVNAAKTPEQLTDLQMQFEQPNRKINNGNYAGRLALTRQVMAQPPGQQIASAADPNTATDASPASAAPALTAGGAGLLSGPIDQATIPGAQPPAAAAPGGQAPAPQQGLLPQPPAAPQPGAPQGGLLAPQAAVPPAVSPITVPSAAAGMAPQAPGADPRAAQLAGLGALSKLYGMGDFTTPLENYYYKSPAYLGQAKTAEAQAQAGVDLATKPQIAGLEAKAKLPFTWGRPGGVLPGVDANGNPNGTFTTAPQLSPQVNPDGTESQSYVGMTPNGPTRSTVPGISKQGPGQVAEQTEAGKNKALYGTPDAPPNGAGTPPIGGFPLAKDIVSKVPDYQEPALSPAELQSKIPEWTKAGREATSAIGMAQQAEHRLTNIADALKMVQSGTFATEKGAFAAALKGAGMPYPTSWDPADIQLALHENYRATLQNLAAVNKRFSQMEFRITSENSEHPNLQPEANLNMLGEDIGTLRQMQGLGTDWQAAQVAGKRNFDAFESQWMNANPLSKISDAVKQEIGPLKGMQPDAAPQMKMFNGVPHYQINGKWYR